MAFKKLDPQLAGEADALIQEHGSAAAASRATGIPVNTLKHRRDAARRDGKPVIGGRAGPPKRQEWKLPEKGQVARYIFTCAQNNTRLNRKVWQNLMALANFYGARVCVSTFTYDKASYGERSVKRGRTATSSERGKLWYAPEIEPHVLDESVTVAPGLVWCGELNIIPTAERPLSGFTSYTGRKSGIFPHVKFAMESVPSGKYEGTKINYTTGTVTQRNYIAKKAGQKAEFHHGYGGLLVEVDSDGNWFCRQLNADSTATIYDLEVRARRGRVTRGHRVEAITWGDIHVGTIEPWMEQLCWGRDNAGPSMIDVLRPRYQFMHDVLDFRARNPHDRGNPHRQFQRHVEGRSSVLAEVEEVGRFLAVISRRPWCRTVVVDSNHDNMLSRWLREADYRSDPPNALFFLEAQLQVYRWIAAGQPYANSRLLRWALGRISPALRGAGFRFLAEDESYIICRKHGGGVECGLHAHNGPDGKRGQLSQFARMGRKSNTGHGHAAGIMDGAYRAGITGALDQGYNAGPSSWTHSHIVTYPNGKRAIITIWGKKWRA